MKTVINTLFAFLSTLFRSRAALQLEVVALRHQLTVYQRTALRLRIHPVDRMFWSWLSRCWSGWRCALVFVQPRIVIAWQRKRFRDHWGKLSKQGRLSRPPVPNEIRTLIRKISAANAGWGSPRIVGELRKVDIDVSKSTVDKYRVRSKQPPSPTWRTFLKTHVTDLVSIPRSPWQNAFVERVIGNIRRDCLDHVIVLDERHLKRMLTSYFTYGDLE